MDECYEMLVPIINYFVERKNSPDWALNEEVLPYYDLTYLVRGEAVYIINGKEVPLGAGDIIYIPKGSVRKAVTNPKNPLHCYAFNFDIHYPEGCFAQLPFPLKFKVEDDNELLLLYRQFNAVWLEKNMGYILKARGIFLLILHRLLSDLSCSGKSQLEDLHIKKIKSYILEHYIEKIRVTDLAEMVKLHPVYLGTHFKKVTGYTLKEYVNRIRINKAVDLLSTGSCTVTHAALLCGFDDIFYFSKVFKQITGRNPSALQTIKTTDAIQKK